VFSSARGTADSLVHTATYPLAASHGAPFCACRWPRHSRNTPCLDVVAPHRARNCPIVVRRATLGSSNPLRDRSMSFRPQHSSYLLSVPCFLLYCCCAGCTATTSTPPSTCSSRGSVHCSTPFSLLSSRMSRTVCTLRPCTPCMSVSLPRTCEEGKPDALLFGLAQ
jgi:hypothetical protein